MEVGYQHINHLEFVAGGDEYIRLSGEGVKNTFFICRALQQSQRSCANGYNSFAGLFCIIDYCSGLLTYMSIFGVHFVVFGVFGFDRQEGSGANMEG